MCVFLSVSARGYMCGYMCFCMDEDFVANYIGSSSTTCSEDFIVPLNLPCPRIVHMTGFHCSIRDPSSAQCLYDKFSLFYERSFVRAVFI